MPSAEPGLVVCVHSFGNLLNFHPHLHVMATDGGFTLAGAQADGSLVRLLKKLARTDLIVIDDWRLERLKDPQAHLILEILEDRQDRGSLMITSQFAVSSWHELIGNPTVADAILDRLVHHAHRIELKGDSMRKMKSAAQRPKT